MQHAHSQRQHETPGENRNEPTRQWHPFSWRRMNSRNAWILLAVAAAFIVIGLAVT